MSGLIKGAHHIALKCTGMEMFEKTIRFYKDVLGMEIVRTWGSGDGSGAMLNTGNCMMEIFASGNTDIKTGSVNHFALAADDVDACVKAVREAGYRISVEPKDIIIQAKIPYPARIAFCIGPVGEKIEFFCEK